MVGGLPHRCGRHEVTLERPRAGQNAGDRGQRPASAARRDHHEAGQQSLDRGPVGDVPRTLAPRAGTPDVGEPRAGRRRSGRGAGPEPRLRRTGLPAPDRRPGRGRLHHQGVRLSAHAGLDPAPCGGRGAGRVPDAEDARPRRTRDLRRRRLRAGRGASAAPQPRSADAQAPRVQPHRPSRPDVEGQRDLRPDRRQRGQRRRPARYDRCRQGGLCSRADRPVRPPLPARRGVPARGKTDGGRALGSSVWVRRRLAGAVRFTPGVRDPRGARAHAEAAGGLPRRRHCLRAVVQRHRRTPDEQQHRVLPVLPARRGKPDRANAPGAGDALRQRPRPRRGRPLARPALAAVDQRDDRSPGARNPAVDHQPATAPPRPAPDARCSRPPPVPGRGVPVRPEPP